MKFRKTWLALVPLAFLVSCGDGNKWQDYKGPSVPVTTSTSESHATPPPNMSAAAPKPVQQGNAISGLVTNVFSPPVGADDVKSQLLFIDTGNGVYRQGLVCFGSGTGLCKVATAGVAPGESIYGYLNKHVTLDGTSTTSVTTSTGTYKPVIASKISVTTPAVDHPK